MTGSSLHNLLPVEQTVLSLALWAEDLRTEILSERWGLKTHVQFIVKYMPEIENGWYLMMILNSWLLKQPREALWDQ